MKIVVLTQQSGWHIDDDEGLVISTPCMRALIKLAGVTLGKR